MLRLGHALDREFTLVLGVAALGCDEPRPRRPQRPHRLPRRRRPRGTCLPPLPRRSPLPIPRSASPAPDTIIAQHILVAYGAPTRPGMTRSKADAKARAGQALAKIRSGTPFDTRTSTPTTRARSTAWAASASSIATRWTRPSARRLRAPRRPGERRRGDAVRLPHDQANAVTARPLELVGVARREQVDRRALPRSLDGPSMAPVG